MKAYQLHTDLLEFYQMVKNDNGWSVVSRDGHVLVSQESKLDIAFHLAVLRSKMWTASNRLRTSRAMKTR